MAKSIDWAWIEREYRAGQLSNRQISVQHERVHGLAVAHQTIARRAGTHGWKKDLGKEIHVAVRRKLHEAGTGGDRGATPGPKATPPRARAKRDKSEQAPEPPPAPPPTDEAIIEYAAARSVEVLLSHRKDIAGLRERAAKLQERWDQDLEKGADDDGPFRRARASVNTLAMALSQIAAVYHRVIPLERQAFMLDTPEGKPKDPVEERECDEDAVLIAARSIERRRGLDS